MARWRTNERGPGPVTCKARGGAEILSSATYGNRFYRAISDAPKGSAKRFVSCSELDKLRLQRGYRGLTSGPAGQRTGARGEKKRPPSDEWGNGDSATHTDRVL
jgi:hypothetical protein